MIQDREQTDEDITAIKRNRTTNTNAKTTFRFRRQSSCTTFVYQRSSEAWDKIVGKIENRQVHRTQDSVRLQRVAAKIDKCNIHCNSVMKIVAANRPV